MCNCYFILFIYLVSFGCAGFLLLHRFFSSSGKWACSLVEVHRLLIVVASLVEHRLYLLHCELSNCGSWALVKFSSVAQSCPTFCDPMDQSMPGLPVHHQLTESTQTQLQSVGDAIQLSKSSVIPFSSCLQSFPASGSFQISQLFASGSQSIGVSASASVLPMNTQDYLWTGWISLQSKGLSRVFSNTTVQKHQFFGAQLSSLSNSHIHT